MIDVCPYPRPDAKNVTSVEGLLYFVWEREAVRVAKEGGWPLDQLTNDPVLKKYKFTNIRRRDDRVSQWIIDHLIQPAVDTGDEHLWFTLLIARLINWPPTLQALLHEQVIPCAPENFDAELFSVTIEALKANDTKVYSGAYMVYPTKMDVGGNKSSAIAKHIIGDVIKNADSVHMSLWAGEQTVQAFVAALSQCFGLSTFMAGQVAADLTYTGMDFEDLYTYAPIGPGSSRGLNYLKGRRPFASWGQGGFNKALIEIRDQIVEQLHIEDMTLHDVQNVMCEFSKYCRCVLNEGVPKTIYKPEELF